MSCHAEHEVVLNLQPRSACPAIAFLATADDRGAGSRTPPTQEKRLPASAGGAFHAQVPQRRSVLLAQLLGQAKRQEHARRDADEQGDG